MKKEEGRRKKSRGTERKKEMCATQQELDLLSIAHDSRDVALIHGIYHRLQAQVSVDGGHHHTLGKAALGLGTQLKQNTSSTRTHSHSHITSTRPHQTTREEESRE